MYEIWLGINIFYELALMYLPLLFVLFVVWAGLMVYAFQKKAHWSKGIKGAMIGGIIATIIAFLVVPGMTKSSLSELGYWFDYVALLGIATMYGAVAAALIWPLSSPKTR